MTFIWTSVSLFYCVIQLLTSFTLLYILETKICCIVQVNLVLTMQPRLVSNPGTSPFSPSCMMRVQMYTTIPSWQSFILSRIETYIWILLLTSLAQLSHFSKWILLWFPSPYWAQIIAHPQNNGYLLLPSPNCPNVSELLIHNLLCFQVQIWIQYPVVRLPTQVERNRVQMPSYSVKKYTMASSIACITSVVGSLCFAPFVVFFPSLRSLLG